MTPEAQNAHWRPEGPSGRMAAAPGGAQPSEAPAIEGHEGEAFVHVE